MVTKPSCFDVAQKNSDSIIHRTQPPPRTHPTTPTLLAVTTDIQIWVSKTMQPFRTHTPTFSLIPDERRANVDASSLSECSTPQRRVGPRKKPSSYFSSKTPKYLEDPGMEIWATEAVGDDASSPDITMMVDAIFIKICNRPFDGLPAHMNSSVLHIIEAYRDLSMEKEQLDEQLGGRDSRLAEAERAWECEDQACRAEIKRPELIIARGKNGMSRLLASRHDSVINRKRNSRDQHTTAMLVKKKTTVPTNERQSRGIRQGKGTKSHSVSGDDAERERSASILDVTIQPRKGSPSPAFFRRQPRYFSGNTATAEPLQCLRKGPSAPRRT
ncbi:hypothetical protein B0J12DRAFT_246706 [Macrophomina phaseolina]|uniref:Uncharacterized protein n=1 Tax=Macrophomina phaseolina TaxID=35725 RepID=A0ABQ8G0C2_9PEZI|nr:hypothetical protein B0J12DRAFT_246706 [Macrophomina phaseolina]